MAFREGHLYLGYIHLMDKSKFFVVARSCRLHAYIVPVNSELPNVVAEKIPECFIPIHPNDVETAPPSASCLQYPSWLSVAPKRGRTLPSLLHRERPSFKPCGKVRTAVLEALNTAIANCRALKRKHRSLLLKETGC